MDSLEEGSVVRTSSPKKDRYAEHDLDLDLSRQLSEMNAYVNDYSDRLHLKGQTTSSRNTVEKKKLKINLGKIKEGQQQVPNQTIIDELKKENARIIDRQAKEIKQAVLQEQLTLQNTHRDEVVQLQTKHQKEIKELQMEIQEKN